MTILRISTHTPLMGRDQAYPRQIPKFEYFYSHAPHGARQSDSLSYYYLLNFYSHAPHGARLMSDKYSPIMIRISTHTPLTGRDFPISCCAKAFTNFYSHAPHGARPYCHLFYFTLIRYFYSHAPHGARHTLPAFQVMFFHISTHTPLTGRDE